MDLKDSWPFFDKIRQGQFVGKNSGYSANIMSRLKKFKTKIIIDGDMWSSPVDRMVFGNTLRMYLTLAPVPHPSSTH